MATETTVGNVNLDRELKRYVRQIRPGILGATSNPNANLAQLLEELKHAKHLRSELAPKLRDFLLTRDYVTALTETGLTLETGVFAEIMRRLEYKLLPKPVESADILSFLSRIFDDESDADWLEDIDRDLFSDLMAMILPGKDELIETLAPQFFMSLEILSLRLAGLGYDPVVTVRMRERREYQHAFMDVTRHVHSMLDGKGEIAIPLIREALLRCAHGVRWVRSKRSSEGISLALTYRLSKIQQVIRRTELILELIECILGEWKSQPARDLFFEIILTEIRRFNMRRFLGQNLELLAFQVTEHTGRAGEHYIARTRREWGAMFWSATLGGAIVGVMVIIKILAYHMHLPPGPEGFLNGLVYAVGFVAIHSLGGTLATKQPAMTASTLATSLDSAKDSREAIENLAEIIVRTVRSQFVALLGNFMVALPVAALIAYPFVLMAHPVMSPEKAMSMIQDLNPFRSLSVMYAAIAGVGLFASGLLAGMVDNWYVFNHVSGRLRNSEVLRRFVSVANLDRTIFAIDHNLGFWAGNITLGFYLGAMPAIGKILGLPLDVRHITFSSGQFGAALATLNFAITPTLAVVVAGGILFYGLVNLGVSFTLSLFVAVKSRRIRFAQTSELVGILLRRLRERPWDYFVAPQDKKTDSKTEKMAEKVLDHKP